jgi:polyhydroxybutyrate depolymerase
MTRALAIGLALALAACTSTASPFVGSPTPSPSPTNPPTSTPSAGGPLSLDDVCATSAADSFDAVARIGEVDRTVLVHRPPGATAGALVIALHGSGMSALGFEFASRLSETADAERFTVVYPQGEQTAREWGVLADHPRLARDTALMTTIVQTLVGDGCADPAKVVTTGFSMGGILSHVLACLDAPRFHAIVAVSARDLGEPCRPGAPVAFVAYNGLLDHALPYEGGELLGFDLESAENWAAGWATRNGCAVGPTVDAASEHVDRLGWSGCRAPVVLYRLGDGGHTWPSGQLGGGSALDTEVAPNDAIVRLLSGQEP